MRFYLKRLTDLNQNLELEILYCEVYSVVRDTPSAGVTLVDFFFSLKFWDCHMENIKNFEF